VRALFLCSYGRSDALSDRSLEINVSRRAGLSNNNRLGLAIISNCEKRRYRPRYANRNPKGANGIIRTIDDCPRHRVLEIARNYQRRVRSECSRGWSTWANVIFRGGRLHRSVAKNIKGDTHAERCEERRAVSPIGTGHQSSAKAREGEN
jgi:hypothetical protein